MSEYNCHACGRESYCGPVHQKGVLDGPELDISDSYNEPAGEADSQGIASAYSDISNQSGLYNNMHVTEGQGKPYASFEMQKTETGGYAALGADAGKQEEKNKLLERSDLSDVAAGSKKEESGRTEVKVDLRDSFYNLDSWGKLASSDASRIGYVDENLLAKAPEEEKPAEKEAPKKADAIEDLEETLRKIAEEQRKNQPHNNR